MLKKTIKFTDYDGNEREQTFYFNLSKAEIAEMELSTTPGIRLSKYLEKIASTRNEAEIIKILKEIILKAYGVKSDDGLRFIKSKELSEEFSQTEAYSELFMELSTNADAAAAFFNNIIPAMPNN